MKKEFEREIKAAYLINYTNMVVDSFMAYYRHYDITKFNFNHIINEANGEVKLLGEDFELLKLNVKKLLEDGYDIEITNDNPIRIKKR